MNERELVFASAYLEVQEAANHVRRHIVVSYPKMGYQVSQVRPHIAVSAHDNRRDGAMLTGPNT